MSGRSGGSAAAVAKRLADFGREIAAAIDKGKNPAVDIPLRTLGNIKFNEKRHILELGDQTQERAFLNVGMAKKFMQTTLVAAGCKEFVEAGKTTSGRFRAGSTSSASSRSCGRVTFSGKS